VTRSYEDVVAALRPTADPDLDRFAQAAEIHFHEAYRLIFGLGEAVAQTNMNDGSASTRTIVTTRSSTATPTRPSVCRRVRFSRGA